MYKLCVLGSPISHSFSPLIHNVFACDGGLDVSYIKIECTKEMLPETVKRLIFEGYHGFNCTMPLKEEITRLADFSDEAVKTLTSANTIKVENKKLYAYTTDGDGLCIAIERKLGKSLENIKVVVAGCGAAARSIIYSLIKRKSIVTILNRTKYDLPFLQSAIFDGLTSETLNLHAKNCDVFINATSLGMNGFDPFPSLDFIKNMRKDAILCDVVYNPIETELIKTAKYFNIQTVDGIDMLIFQGALAFKIWTGIFPSEKAINKAYLDITDTIKKGSD